jgi:hypothetical protein
MDEYYSTSLTFSRPSDLAGLFIAMGKHPTNRYEKLRYGQRFAGFG